MGHPEAAFVGEFAHGARFPCDFGAHGVETVFPAGDGEVLGVGGLIAMALSLLRRLKPDGTP